MNYHSLEQLKNSYHISTHLISIRITYILIIIEILFIGYIFRFNLPNRIQSKYMRLYHKHSLSHTALFDKKNSLFNVFEFISKTPS